MHLRVAADGRDYRRRRVAMTHLLAFLYEGQYELPSNALLVPVLEAACRLQVRSISACSV